MRRFVILLILICISFEVFSQRRRGPGYWYIDTATYKGDTIAHVHMLPAYKFSRKRDMRRYRRLVAAVLKVYPIAQEAKREMQNLEDEMSRLKTKKEQKEYIKGVQQRIIKKYTPVLKKMTRYEGTILLKLIDRETEFTAYQIVKELRGGFVAGFWQGMAKLFGNNLKLEYDKMGKDSMIEYIVVMHERGLI